MKKLGKPEPDSDVVNKEPNVLLIGYGWVGQYMGKLFKDAWYTTGNGKIVKQGEEHLEYDEESDGKFDLAIIGVPTPMNPKTGECETHIVDEVVGQWKHIVEHFLIKSTVAIGTTDRLRKKHGVKIAMSPEYVGETLGHPLIEIDRDQFQIFGGKRGTREAIAEMFSTVLTAQAPILLCSAKEAEVIKYSENMWIAQRVSYWRQIKEVCDHIGISFTRVREGICLDPRMSRTHSNVYPNNRGWSGKCLPKDMNAFVHEMWKRSLPMVELIDLIKHNAEVRKDYNDKNKLIPDNPVWDDIH